MSAQTSLTDITIHESQEPNSRAAAETTLLAFRKSVQPIQACQYILGQPSPF